MLEGTQKQYCVPADNGLLQNALNLYYYFFFFFMRHEIFFENAFKRVGQGQQFAFMHQALKSNYRVLHFKCLNMPAYTRTENIRKQSVVLLPQYVYNKEGFCNI